MVLEIYTILNRYFGVKGGIDLKRYGVIKIKLNDLLAQSGLSKNKLGQRAEMQRTQINKYCNNTVTRLDIDVLARLCTVLNCSIGDLLELQYYDRGNGYEAFDKKDG